MACAGPMPIVEGGTPVVVVVMYFPRMEGVRERDVAVERRARTRAVAPSESWEELAAVVVPGFLKAGFKVDMEVGEALWRIPSSAVIVTVEAGWGVEVPEVSPPSEGGLVMVTGMISLSKRPAVWAAEALRWEDVAKASWSAREML